MKSILYLILVSLCCCGCNIIGNLDQISTLQNYSKEMEAQHKMVKEIDARYDALSKAIADGRIHDYKDEASFTKEFGGPILKRNLPDGTERWLYRYAIYKTAHDKTYIYFDTHGQLMKWEKAECPKFF